ncbi:hypothetical protein Nhal_1767 [Nitrosococcus halophilus Nc 4]|uniref:Uncharacterized protein n=1 Tax=Nitrosococcus halophilus (strain Nc4) TaxID=472759 RepID=D5C2Z6_NITHN|nr:hypothetical protein Nhal_1767 [Nitrosococcus halophilus Nc 4]
MESFSKINRLGNNSDYLERGKNRFQRSHFFQIAGAVRFDG